MHTMVGHPPLNLLGKYQDSNKDNVRRNLALRDLQIGLETLSHLALVALDLLLNFDLQKHNGELKVHPWRSLSSVLLV